MNNFEYRVLRIEPINTAVQRCASRSSAVQRYARKSTEFAWGSKIIGENQGEMKNSSVTQGSANGGICCTFPFYICVDRPSRSHHEQFRTQGSAHRAY